MWTITDSKRLYRIGEWGEGFFSINNKGHLSVLPDKSEKGPAIDIADVIEEMKAQKIEFPAVIRFHDILRSQVASINKTFGKVVEEARYQGRYIGVYPIKVNQMREVVEEIVDAGSPFDYGLEAGSKAELLTVLAMNTNKNSLTILNGYKDAEFMRLAVLGRKLGRKVIVVIEKFSELNDLIKINKEMGMAPLIGLRVRLSVKGAGKWADSTGERAKFGLSIAELLQAIKLLKDEKLDDNIKLFHFHIGSQIPDIRTLKDAFTEGARIFTKLVKMGIDIEYFDVGGGLGINYDGTNSVTDSSTNYSLKDYAEDVVYILKQICDLEEVEHPNIVTESGRAITAHHSCIIANVFGRVEMSPTSFPTNSTPGEHILVKNMRDLHKDVKKSNIRETYNDALQFKDECANAFKLGIISLEERAKIETLFWKICKDVLSMALKMESAPQEILDIKDKLSDQYLCNFSIFQSAPDTWAIDQVIPVVPITRLNEQPDNSCNLVDITCDSDGKIDMFIGEDGDIRPTMPLHKLKKNQEYFIGLFLTGAYQDIMGDNHNLFGRLNEVHVFSDDEDPTDFYIEEVIKGNTAEQILATLQYNPQYMAATVKKALDQQIRRGKLRPREGVALADFYEESLRGYTYLKK